MGLKSRFRYHTVFRLAFLPLLIGSVVGIVCLRTAEAEAPPTEAWRVAYNGSFNGNDAAHKIVIDTSGNIYVTGTSFNGFRDDIVTVKYDPNGNQVWDARYNNANTNSSPAALAVDSSGNIYVTGYNINNLDGMPDYVTIKYRHDGTEDWVSRYHNVRDDVASGLAVDPSGNVYVTGYSFNDINYDGATIKYDSAGNQLWVVRHDSGGDDFNIGLALDTAWDIYVVGQSANNYLTVKYSSAGAQYWAVTYDNGGIDAAIAVALDSFGNIFTSGNSSNGLNNDFATVKYDPNGVQLWASRYNNGGEEGFSALTLDTSGNAYITGSSSNGLKNDYATVKYSPIGVQLWAARYNNSAGRVDHPFALALDISGNVYVTGKSDNGSNDDQTTVKYSPTGTELWVVRYDNIGEDQGLGVSLDPSGNVYVTGVSFNGTNGDYSTVKYIQGDSSASYAFGGFLPPLTENATYKIGRTLPIKFELFDDVGGEVPDAVAHLFLQKLSGTEPVGDPIEASSTSGGDSGNLFRFDGGQYIFNLDTRPLSAGTWQLRVMIDDGSTHTIEIGLKAK